MLFLPIYSQILKDIESSTSSTLTVVERNVNQTFLAMQGVDTRLQGFQSSLMNFFLQNPSAGLFLPDAPLILFDAIGRVLTVPAHLTGSFDVSRSIGANYHGLIC
jgi:hypothetical protein